MQEGIFVLIYFLFHRTKCSLYNKYIFYRIKRRPNGTVLYGTPTKGLPHDF